MTVEQSNHHNHSKKHKIKAQFSKYRTGSIVGLVIFILVFGGIGLKLLFSSKAATPLVSTAPVDAAATGGEVCPGGAQANQLVSPHTSAPASGYRGTTSTVVISGDTKPSMTPNTTYYFTTGSHKVGQLIPQARDVFVGAPGAILDGNNTSENAFASYTDNASYVTIEFLTIKNYRPQQDQWVINTDSGANWTITHNTIGPNTRGAGLGLGDNSVITYNCITHNGQYGINGYDNNDNVTGNDHNGTRGGPVRNVTISHNQIDTNDVYTIPDPDGSGPLPAGCAGCGYDNYPTPDIDVSQCPYPADCGVSGGAKFWNEVDMTFDYNVVTDNHHTGIWADTSNQNNIYDHNYFGDNWGIAIWYEVSYNPTITNNKFVRNAIVDGAREKSKLDGAIYFSESGYDSRVDGGRGGTTSTACGTCAEVSGNAFQDNWSGVAEWENPNRYCSNGLPTTNCTLVNPAATLTSCSRTKSNGGLEPNSPVHYVSPTDPSYDCRWRTKNIYVHNNNFAFSPGVVNTALDNLATNGDDAANSYKMSSTLCSVTNGCGFNITVSQWGSVAFWPKDLVPNAITFEQNLKYDYNNYTGDWHFDVHELGGTNLTPTQWQTALGSTDTSSGDHGGDNINHPAQDAHSTFNNIPPPPPDSTLPTVSLTAPLNGATIHGQSVSVAATASDNVAVTKVVFSVGTTVVNSDTTSPYGFALNSTNFSNGSHTITAKAFDAAGNTKTSSVTVTFSNGDVTPPTVTLTAPANGSTVTGTVALAATAADNIGVTKVVFSVGGTVISTDTSSPYSASWNSATVNNGSQTVVAKAYDAANNITTDSNVVTVSNGDTQPPSTPTGLHASAPAYNKVNLSWTASTDNVGVAGYYVVRGTTTIAQTVGTGVSYVDNTVAPSTSYSYKVMAYDARGNTSALSTAVQVTTPAQTDTQAPTAPTNLNGKVMSDNQINLSWGPSTDNIGVTGYYVFYTNNGLDALKGIKVSSSTLSIGVSGLLPNSTYALVVVAHDAAGNISPQSNVVIETTLPYSAPANLAGVVYSSAGGVISGATATIHYYSEAHTYSTNSLGQYYMADVAPKTYPAATFYATGFTTKQVAITALSGQTVHTNVTLVKQ